MQLKPLLLLLAITTWHAGLTAMAGDPPNIMIIMADDLGFSDLGCYGGEIETPNLDGLANGGIRFSRFYNTGRCWPTRASLMTGYYAQQVRRDKLPGIQPSGMGGQRPAWAPMVPVRLRKAGYRGYHTGKWHLDSTPIKAGFDESYFLGDQARFFSPKTRFLNDEKLPAIPRGTDYYATTDLATQTIEILKRHSARHAEQPFVHYLALTAPHFPLHALPEDIAKYREIYRRGWDEIRKERWQRIQQLQIISGQLSKVESETGAPYPRPQDIKAYGPGEVAFPAAWDQLTDEQKEFQATKMAIHAAMVDRIDQELGRIFQHLRDTNQFENTLILFFSDNGSSSELMIRDDGHDPNAEPGSADTHLCLGPGWSTVGNTPFRKHKTWVHEGGIATPLIAHWPQGIQAAGTWNDTPGHVVDVVPTCLELAGLDLDSSSENEVAFPGRSLASALLSDQEGKLAEPRDWLWWSHENHRAIQVENWKAVKTSTSEWQLYDLTVDRTESNDLASVQPEQLQEMVAKWTSIQNDFIRDAKRE